MTAQLRLKLAGFLNMIAEGAVVVSDHLKKEAKELLQEISDDGNDTKQQQ